MKPDHVSELRDEVLPEPVPPELSEQEEERLIRYLGRAVRSAIHMVPWHAFVLF
jgi:hypothetical protein